MAFLDGFGSSQPSQGGSFLSGFGTSATTPSSFLSSFGTQTSTPATAATSPLPAPFDNTPLGILKNTITGLPAAAANLALKVPVVANTVEGLRSIYHGVTTGDWQPYQNHLASNSVDYSKILSPNADERFAQVQKLGSMVLGFTNPGGEFNAGDFGEEGAASSLPESTPGNAPEAAGAPRTEPPIAEGPTPPRSISSGDVSPSETGGTPAIPESSSPNTTINTDNLAVSPESKTLLENIQSDLTPKTAAKIGPVMSNQEVQDFAKANPNLVANQVSRDASLKYNASLLNARKTLADTIQNGGSNEDIIKAFMQVKTAGTDLARGLQSMSIDAAPGENSTLTKMLNDILKTGANIDDVIAAAKNVDFSDYNQAVSFYRQYVKPTAGDWIDLVRYNSMLSSPLTLSNISAGNAANIAAQPVVKSAAGAIDWMKTGIFGGEQTHFVGEGPAYAKGAAENIGSAFNNMMDVLKGNLDPKMLDFNVPIASEGETGTLVKTMNFFSTLHNAMYQFFNTIAKGGSDASIAYKAAQGVDTPLPDMAAQAEADYATFRAGSQPDGQGGVLNAIDSVAGAFKQC